jgi:hypothetical protein
MKRIIVTRQEGNHTLYDLRIMLKLVVVKCFRQFSYRDELQELIDEYCHYLGLP